MKQRVVKVEQDQEVQSYKLILEDDPSPEAGKEKRGRQVAFLMELAQSPDLQMCGYWAFEKMRMFHNGTRWVIELEADRPQT